MDLELAARAAIQDNAWTYRINTGAAEIIELVEGNPRKAAELINLLTFWKDEIMNDFASIQEFHVFFKENSS